ncbi:uncharacterized protein LOC120144674 [Hibiscus syriacus]|uniref:uncharacterized protein LOC120144674 n=1 Tax=Hibiscus syriacus TaxID=106335 RepID=UPI001921FE32|nr:uncharacterized protein LOC120144674 [Hibiscus syriacus]
MFTLSIQRTEFLNFFSHGSVPLNKFQRLSLCPTMKMDSKSFEKVKKEELSIQLQKSSVPQLENPRPSNLRFNRLQPSDHELNQDHILEFGRFVAREAVLDEEFWTAAWLRAETHWEDRLGERYADNVKRQFAEEEFNAIKRLYSGQQGQTYTCVVTVRKEERNVKHTVLKSVVGTLDFSIRHLLHGESFPGEREKHMFCSISRTDLNKYVYVSNLCVAKSARRQSIASNMLYYVIESVRSKGVEPVTCMFIETMNPLLNCIKRLVLRWLKWQITLIEAADVLALLQDMKFLLKHKSRIFFYFE